MSHQAASLNKPDRHHASNHEVYHASVIAVTYNNIVGAAVEFTLAFASTTREQDTYLPSQSRYCIQGSPMVSSVHALFSVPPFLVSFLFEPLPISLIQGLNIKWALALAQCDSIALSPDLVRSDRSGRWFTIARAGCNVSMSSSPSDSLLPAIVIVSSNSYPRLTQCQLGLPKQCPEQLSSVRWSWQSLGCKNLLIQRFCKSFKSNK